MPFFVHIHTPLRRHAQSTTISLKIQSILIWLFSVAWKNCYSCLSNKRRWQMRIGTTHNAKKKKWIVFVCVIIITICWRFFRSRHFQSVPLVYVEHPAYYYLLFNSGHTHHRNKIVALNDFSIDHLLQRSINRRSTNSREKRIQRATDQWTESMPSLRGATHMQIESFQRTHTHSVALARYYMHESAYTACFVLTMHSVLFFTWRALTGDDASVVMDRWFCVFCFFASRVNLCCFVVTVWFRLNNH